MKHVWKGHGADSEIGNVSARQAALNRWTAIIFYFSAQDTQFPRAVNIIYLFIYLFIYSFVRSFVHSFIHSFIHLFNSFNSFILLTYLLNLI